MNCQRPLLPRPSWSLPSWSLLILASLLLIATGCTDGLSVNEDTGPASTKSGKVLYRHLFDQAITTNTSSNDSGTTGLIIQFSSTTVSAKRFLRRYTFLRRYKFLRRYTFENAFPGIAIYPKRTGGNYHRALERFFRAVNRDGEVAWIAPDVALSTPTPFSTSSPQVSPSGGRSSHEITPWNVEHIGATSPQNASNVELYILDTGVQASDLNVAENLNFSTSSSAGDALGHGTHVAGIAAAQDNDAGVLGVAADARVINAKVLNDEGQAQTSTVIAALDQIIGRKKANPSRPMVVNLSLGANVGTSSYGPLDYAIEKAIDAGIVVVIAAGNEGIDASTVTPAHVTSAITVGAYDRNDTFADFSNYGSVVDLLAPGVNIRSLALSRTGRIETTFKSGTSMAAPHVAGAAVRYLTQHPDATPAQVHDALIMTGKAEVTGAPSGTTTRSVWVDQ